METWCISSHSGANNNCVEVGFAVKAVGVRDTKDREGARLTFGPSRWQAFLTTLKHGTYNR